MGSKEKSLHIEFGMSIGFAGIETYQCYELNYWQTPWQKNSQKIINKQYFVSAWL